MSVTQAQHPASPDEYARRIEKAIAEHPPMPALYRDLLPYINDPDVDYGTLSKIIRNDPGVTMNVLRVANSAYFTGEQKVDSVRQAFVRLGSHRLFQIILAQGVATRLAGSLFGYGLEPRGLLVHSVGVAVTSEHLANYLQLKTVDMLFTAGLLHDMGKVILDPFVRECRSRFDELLRDTERPFDSLECELLGTSHAEAGAQLMRQWMFPEDVIEIVQYHHHPERTKKYHTEALMVHLANALVASQGFGNGIDGLRYPVADHAAEQLGLVPRDMEKLSSQTLDQLRELEETME